MKMTAQDIGKLAYEANLSLIQTEIDHGLAEGATEHNSMLVDWEETPKFVREIYEQYVRLIIHLPETMLPHQIQAYWIKDQESRGWKAGDEFSYESMTNCYLVPATEWDNNARNRFFITYGTANSFRRFYVETPECYTETIQRTDIIERLDGSTSQMADKPCEEEV